MSGQGKLITGMLVGAGTMYLLDPDRGSRRRSLLRDQGVHLGHKLGDGLGATARDTKNRTIGLAFELRSRFRQDQPGDEILQDRVRSAIGRLVSHPSAVSVTAFEGRVTLSGHVLEDELSSLLRGVGRVRGVREVDNELEVHQSEEGLSALQGSGRAREPGELTEENWAPAVRVAIGTLGGVLAVQGTRTKGAPGNFLSLLGLSLLARAASNIPARKLVELGIGQPGFVAEKTILVSAPVGQVWELWSHFENFPRFMAHLREVRKIDEGRSHWVAAGPAGISAEWDAVVTDWVPSVFIGWTSVEGSSVETTGQVRLRAISEGETQIDVQLSYRPPAGAAGHALATLLGTDPKQAMDEDLTKLKSLLEDQKTSTSDGPVHLQEVIAGEKSATRRQRSRKKS